MNFFTEQEELRRVYDETFGVSEGDALGKLNTDSLAMLQLCTPRMNVQIYVQICAKMCRAIWVPKTYNQYFFYMNTWKSRHILFHSNEKRPWLIFAKLDWCWFLKICNYRFWRALEYCSDALCLCNLHMLLDFTLTSRGQCMSVWRCWTNRSTHLVPVWSIPFHPKHVQWCMLQWYISKKWMLVVFMGTLSNRPMYLKDLFNMQIRCLIVASLGISISP